MPSLRTEITEIVTALGTTGASDLESAIEEGPSTVRNVSDSQWERLRNAFATQSHQPEFQAAWSNGVAFYQADEGLRGRRPILIEWKGSHNPPGFDFLPADLRIDHVFLVSCKYLSRILANSSPGNLFIRLLADRTAGGADWYEFVALSAYRRFYDEVRLVLNEFALPLSSSELSIQHLEYIRSVCSGTWPPSLLEPWKLFSLEVSQRSAEVWSSHLTTLRQREDMLWRLLRLNPAPYFVLGSSPTGSLRLRIGTPWDWRQLFEMRDFEILPGEGGQPEVRWEAVVRNRASGLDQAVKGHVEIRWSHGRFSGVEAKAYLDIPHADVPGYFALA